jgi:hypothetical protein
MNKEIINKARKIRNELVDYLEIQGKNSIGPDYETPILNFFCTKFAELELEIEKTKSNTNIKR